MRTRCSTPSSMPSPERVSRAAEEQQRLSQSDRDALEIYAAVCDLRLKRLSRRDVEQLPVTGDDSAALKMYLQSELARNKGKPTSTMRSCRS